MSVVNFDWRHSMEYDINRDKYSYCNICGKSLTDIKKEIGGENVYFSEAFVKHIKSHGITKEEYFEKITERPTCLCGICNKKTDITIRGAKIYWRKYACGRFPGQQEWSRLAKESRKGINNPMFGKKPWNKGLSAECNESIRRMADNNRGKKATEEQRKHMSESAKKRKIHGHTGHKHSPETIAMLRENTARLHAKGRYNHTNTLPFREMCSILDNMGILYESEKIVEYYSYDIYLPEYDVYIEVDGDFFHVNPLFYPDGPICKVQRRNKYNDRKKDEFSVQNNLKVFRFWENDIKNNKEKVIERLSCILKK